LPVNGFWSVSVYNADGYYEKNPYDAYTLNNLTAKKGATAPDCDPVRRLRWPRYLTVFDHKGLETTPCGFIARAPKILNGTWKFPEPQPAS